MLATWFHLHTNIRLHNDFHKTSLDLDQVCSLFQSWYDLKLSESRHALSFVFAFSSIISKSIITALTIGNIFSLTRAFFSCSHPSSKPRVGIIHDYGNLKLHMWPLSAAHCIWTCGLAGGCVSTGTASPLSGDSAIAGSSVARCFTKGPHAALEDCHAGGSTAL